MSEKPQENKKNNKTGGIMTHLTEKLAKIEALVAGATKEITFGKVPSSSLGRSVTSDMAQKYVHAKQEQDRLKASLFKPVPKLCEVVRVLVEAMEEIKKENDSQEDCRQDNWFIDEIADAAIERADQLLGDK